MDEATREILLEFLRDSLEKGYSPDTLKNMLIERNIQEKYAADLINFVRLSVVPREIKENSFMPRFLVFSSVSIMVLIYIVKIFLFSLGAKDASVISKLITGFWPLALPFTANFINLIFYRRYFLRGFFITLILIGLLVFLVIILAILGI